METNAKKENNSFASNKNYAGYNSTHFTTREGVHKSSSLPDTERESWKEMAEHLYLDMVGLWKKESQLVRTEMSEKLSEFKKSSFSMAIGGTVLFYAGLCLVATAVLALNFVLELWAAAGVVGVFLLVVGAVITTAAKKKLEANNLKPTQSIEALGTISHTLKERFHEIKKH